MKRYARTRLESLTSPALASGLIIGLALGLTACTNPSESELAAWHSLAEEALTQGMAEPAKTEIYEPWADARGLPQPGAVYDMGRTIGQEIARSRTVLSWQAIQGTPNSYPSYQPERFSVEISRAAWDLALRGYQYDLPEAPPVAPVALPSVASQSASQGANQGVNQGANQPPLSLAGVPVDTLKALEASHRADQSSRPDCLRILGRTIFNYCSIDTMAQACFGRTCQYFDIPSEQGIELNAGFDSLVGQRHPRDGGHPIRADRSRYAAASYFIPLAVPVASPQPLGLQPSSNPAVQPGSPPLTPPASKPSQPFTPIISEEEKQQWDKEPLFAPAN